MGQQRYTTYEYDGATVLRVHGEVDVATAPDLRDALVRVCGTTPPTHLIVDLAEVTFLDNTGVGVLAVAHLRVTSDGGWFTVVVNTPLVRRVLQLAGLLRVWRVTSSIEDALHDV